MASQSSQQQFQTIASIVRQCCEDEASFQELTAQIIVFLKSNQSNKEAAKPVVDTIKQVIKDKKSDSTCKLMALKLLHRCVLENQSAEFMTYMEKKIMSRLAILARHKKESSDIERGANMFGKQANQRASADFLKLLLLYLQSWATHFPMYPQSMGNLSGKPTETAKIYQQLAKDKVHFSTEEIVMQSLCPDYQASDGQSSSVYNPSSTAPQSLNHSAFLPGPASSTPPLPEDRPSRAAFGTATPSSLNTSSANLPHRPSTSTASQLEGSARKSLTATATTTATLTSQGGTRLSKEQQVEIANKIKADYKRLNEYQGTARLAKEVMEMPGEADAELMLSFGLQIREGKEFSEGFLKTIIESPFTIKDRDSKIEKILGIIGELEAQLSVIKAKNPSLALSLEAKATTPQGTAQGRAQPGKLESKTPAPKQIKQVENKAGVQDFLKTPNPTSQAQEKAKSIERKGILKTSKFQSHNGATIQVQQEEEKKEAPFSDFKFDQSVFKTNFAFNPNQSMSLESKLPPAPEQVNTKANNDFFSSSQWGSNFTNINQSQSFFEQQPSQPAAAPNFDFGIEFANQRSVPQPAQTAFEDFNWEANHQSQRQNLHHQQKPFNEDVMRPSIGNGSRRRSIIRVGGISRRSSHASLRKSSEASIGQEDSIIMGGKKLMNHQPQIYKRNPDSNPVSDGEGEHLSSSGEKHNLAKIPASITESMQGMQTQREQTAPPLQANKPDNEFSWRDTTNFFSKLRNSFVEATSSKGSSGPKAEPLPAEKFDFSEVQITGHSSSKQSQKSTPRTTLPPQETGEDLKLQLERANLLAQGLEKELQKLKEANDKLQAELKKCKHYEFLFEEEKLARAQREREVSAALATSDDYKRQAERLEAKASRLQRELEQAGDLVVELRGAQAQHERDLEVLRASEAESKGQLQRELLESLKREEELKARWGQEEAEGRRREAYMKEQWLRDLQDKERSEEEWERRAAEQEARLAVAEERARQELERALMEKELEGRRRAQEREQELMREIEVLKRQVKEAKETPQKIVVKSTDIKFKASASPVHSDKGNKSAVSPQNPNTDFSFPDPAPSLAELSQPPQINDFFPLTSTTTAALQAGKPPVSEDPQQEITEFDILRFDPQEPPTQTLNLLSLVVPTSEAQIVRIKEQHEERDEESKEEINYEYTQNEMNESEEEVAEQEPVKEDLPIKAPVFDPFEGLGQEPANKAPVEAFFDFVPIAQKEPEVHTQQLEVNKKKADFDFSSLEGFTSDPLAEEEKRVVEYEPEKNELLLAQVPLQETESKESSQETPNFEPKPEVSLFENEKDKEKDFQQQQQQPNIAEKRDIDNEEFLEVKPQFQDYGKFKTSQYAPFQPNQDVIPFTQTQNSENKQKIPSAGDSMFNIDDILSGIIDTKPITEKQQTPIKDQAPTQIQILEDDPFRNVPALQTPSKRQQFNTVQTLPLNPLDSPKPTVVIDKTQFATFNTETYQRRQEQDQTQQQAQNPQLQLYMKLITAFRKSLMQSKSVLYEDPNIQIGLVTDIQPALIRMRLFFGNKQQTLVTQLSFRKLSPSAGFSLTQSRDSIPSLFQGQQEPLDLILTPESCLFTSPVFGLSYRLPPAPGMPESPPVSLTLRLPILPLKLCTALPRVHTAEQFKQLWNSGPGEAESRLTFNIDFSQCRSLTQLKETLQGASGLARGGTFVFVDEVEDKKNLVCGGTLTQAGGRQVWALIKIRMTVDGRDCEIQAKSGGEDPGDTSKFGRQTIANIMELIALPQLNSK